MERIGWGTRGADCSIRQVALASFVGTAIEWYDFFLYGTAAALVFNKLFFPEFSRPLVSSWRSRPTRSASRRGLWAAWSSGTTGTGSDARPCCPVAPHHGYRDVPYRVLAHLRNHRRPGSDAARRLALLSGHRSRRGVGRGRADGGRARPGGPARLLRKLAADGGPCWSAARQPGLLRVLRRLPEGRGAGGCRSCSASSSSVSGSLSG